MHDALTNTSRLDDYTQNDVGWSGALYKGPNIARTYSVAKTDWYTPTDMRAPGGTTGMWAIESAMDELAHAALHGRLGTTGARNESGDAVKKLDDWGHDCVATVLEKTGACSAFVSEEAERPLEFGAQESARDE